MDWSIEHGASFDKLRTGRAWGIKFIRFQCSRLRLKGFGAASSVPRCRFASDGIFDRFQLLWLYFLTPDT